MNNTINNTIDPKSTKSANDFKTDAEELIEKIYSFKKDKCQDLGLMDTMIEFSYKFNIPLQEMGNILSEHKIFVGILEKQLEREGFIKKPISSEEETKKTEEINEEEW